MSNIYRSQASASIECTTYNACNGIGDGYRGQASATIERIVSNACNGINSVVVCYSSRYCYNARVAVVANICIRYCYRIIRAATSNVVIESCAIINSTKIISPNAVYKKKALLPQKSFF